MSIGVNEYLLSVKHNLRLEDSDEKEIINELASHIEDEVQELKNHGLRDEEAVAACLRLLGSAKLLGHQIYEAHSQGTWKQALMASLPHILFGLIFTLNWWRGIGGVLIMLILMLGTTAWGWWHHKSTWLFPWLGYSLLPVIAAGLSLLYLPRTLAWLAIIVYIPLAFWLMYRIISRTIQKDWIYLSLMLLPMPIIISWFLVAQWRSDFSKSTFDLLYHYGPWIGVSFLALALGVVSFVRVRRRWLKIAVLFITGVITLALISFYALSKLDLVTFLLMILFLSSIFLIPALLGNGVRSGKWGKIFEPKTGSRF
jgi:hypothetical protein